MKYSHDPNKEGSIFTLSFKGKKKKNFAPSKVISQSPILGKSK